MVTRVIGIPDRNGVITISCGGDIIEIHVANVAQASGDAIGPASGSTGGGPPPTTNPFNDPFAGIVADFKDNPFKLPSAYIMSTASGGKIDTPYVVKHVLDQIADQYQANPRAVVLAMNNVNLHDLSHLGQRIASEAPGIPIAIDFGGILKE